jgi:hypothetical protein
MFDSSRTHARRLSCAQFFLNADFARIVQLLLAQSLGNHLTAPTSIHHALQPTIFSLACPKSLESITKQAIWSKISRRRIRASQKSPSMRRPNNHALIWFWCLQAAAALRSSLQVQTFCSTIQLVRVPGVGIDENRSPTFLLWSANVLIFL